MQRHCDAWLADGRGILAGTTGAPTSPVVSWTIHVGQWKEAHTTGVASVVEFRLADGTEVNVPVWCSVYPPGDATCDLGDVTLPPN
jgi:ferric-dicitrate binding protein FerR (iron transport regulator)